jgi:peptide deformylase
MAVREILHVGNPLLREPARIVTTEELATPELQTLIDDLIDTMHAAHGAGIPLTVVVNPVIEALDEELVEINEGCLSVPNLRGNVMRHVNVRVRWLDRDGVPHDEIKRGLTAGTFQHECDHLDGVLFVDRLVDTHTLTTWEQFERFHRDAFVARITAFVERVGS